MNNAVINHYYSYNERRYSTPWVCEMTADGKYNFEKRIGTYTGNGRKGEEGDLVVFEPVVGQVYGYGQKDYRGNKTEIGHAKWDGEKFVECDKLGRPANQKGDQQ